MKLVPVTPVSKSGFNHAAAEKARAWVMEDYERALAALPFALYESVQGDIFDHRETIQKALDVTLEPQLSAISKAMGDDPFARDQRGRFSATESRRKKRVTYTPAKKTKLPREAPKGHGLGGEEASRYAQAYAQVAEELSSAMDNGFDAADTFWTAAYRDRDGSLSVHRGVGLTPENVVKPSQFKGGGRLVELSLTTKPTLSAGGAGYDLMTAMSNPATAGAIGAAMGRGNEVMTDDAKRNAAITGLNGYGPATDPTTTTRLFNRLRAAGQLSRTLMGDSAPGQAKLAADVATWVGTHGPEAEKVLGPPTRRAAYRYRGVEKRPDPRLQGTIDAAIKARRAQAVDGMGTAEINARARQAVIYGWTRPASGRPGDPRSEFVESPLISYFKERLPNPDLYDLQRKSGTIPPSQGVIIDRHGRVAHEAVGYGEDWYLPFNLKNLKDLKGGEYVRTRAYGGLTTEDIYTGLVSGARSVTVVSNSGTFTLEFDDTFRGGRRLNDKAARMVSRYGYLLDAVGSGKVSLDSIEPSRLAELGQQAARRHDPVTDPEGYASALDVLKQREKLNPTLSAAMTSQVTTAVLDQAARDYAERSGIDGVTAVTELAEAEGRTLRGRLAAAGVPADKLDEAAGAVLEGRWGTPDAQAASLGVQRQVAAALDKARQDQVARTKTLSLDGEGFDYAAKALQEQFPYYIARYEARDLRGRTDRGYVKPRFNRPEGAKAGYFDPSITGRGKTSADRINHQNYGVRRPEETQKAAAPAAAGDVPAESAATKPAAGPSLLEQKSQRDALLSTVSSLQTAGTFGANATGTMRGVDWGQMAGKPIGDTSRAQLKAKFPSVFADDVEGQYRSSAAFQAELAKELTDLERHKVFDIDLSAALGRKKASAAKWDPAEAVSSSGGDFDFGPDFDLDAGGSDPVRKAEHFEDLIDTDPDITYALDEMGIEAGDIGQLPALVATARKGAVAAVLDVERRAGDYARDPLGYRDSAPGKTEREDALRVLKGLDKAAQAARNWGKAREAQAVSGKVVAGEAAPAPTQRLILDSPDQLPAALEAVQRSGSAAQLGGEVDLEALLRQAGLNPS